MVAQKRTEINRVMDLQESLLFFLMYADRGT